MNTKTIIRRMGTGRIGSFGEYLFGLSVKGAVRGGGQGADYDVPNFSSRVDVKTTLRNMNCTCPTDGTIHFGGSMDDGEIRANVVFYKDVVSVHYDDAPIRLLTWDEINIFLMEWLSKNGKTVKYKKKMKNHNRLEGFMWIVWHVKELKTALDNLGKMYIKLTGKEKTALIMNIADKYDSTHPNDPYGGIRNLMYANYTVGNQIPMYMTWMNFRLFAAAYIVGIFTEKELMNRTMQCCIKGAIKKASGSLRTTFIKALKVMGYELKKVQ